MAFINITTNNQSRELTNSRTFEDNWVYVPGVAITGDWTRPYALTTVDEFKQLFGPEGPEGSITFQYVTGLLNAGVPVLFRRIAYNNQHLPTHGNGVVQAKAAITDSASEDATMLTIYEKYGGTYGNNLVVTLRDTTTAYYVEVSYKNTLVEKKRILTYSSTSQTQTEINTALIEALTTTEFDKVTFDVAPAYITDPSKFTISTVSKALSGGVDYDTTTLDIRADIVQSYKFIEDKILYQPKFITSGGYTDLEPETSHAIATAMQELTLKRQDCRALIDLPAGKTAEEQQEMAAVLVYQQTSDSTPIPSASVCAPWCYMQVGNEQVWMPPSYVYLTVVGSELSKGGKVYTPKAGIYAGRIANVIKPEFEIGSDISEAWQSDSKVNINPIMRLQGGNYVIEGNSTLLLPDPDEENAFSESSADLTVIEIRRFVYNLATELQYQYNSLEAFETFSLKTAKFLETMKSEGSVMDYEIANKSTNDEPRKLKIQLIVYLSPTIKKIDIYLNVAYGNIELGTGGVE